MKKFLRCMSLIAATLLVLTGIAASAEGWAWVEEPTPAQIGSLRLSGISIGLDPGHQIRQNSAHEPIAPGSSETKPKVSSGTAGVKSRIPEYQVNLDVGLQLRDYLESLGATVYMTREVNEVDISNMERALMMNELGVDLVLRLHCNGSTNRSANGVGLYVTKTGPIAEESLAIAEVLMPAYVEYTGARKDGIFRRDTYTGQNWSTVPCIMVEMGFMSNPEEDLKLTDPAYQQKIVQGIAEGICRYYGR